MTAAGHRRHHPHDRRRGRCERRRSSNASRRRYGAEDRSARPSGRATRRASTRSRRQRRHADHGGGALRGVDALGQGLRLPARASASWSRCSRPSPRPARCSASSATSAGSTTSRSWARRRSRCAGEWTSPAARAVVRDLRRGHRHRLGSLATTASTRASTSRAARASRDAGGAATTDDVRNVLRPSTRASATR